MSARLALRLTLALAACAAPVLRLPAQPPAPSPATHRAVDAAKLPPLPPLRSPVDQFRDLLAMAPAAREDYLAKRTPEMRARIMAKVAQYEAMTPEEREKRLRVTQIRWYLLTLMQTPATAHAVQLAALPDADRPLVTDRLREWDQLPADEQKAFLKYEKTMEQFEDEHLDAATAARNVSQVPPPQRSPALQNLDNFLQLPPEQREQIYGSFKHFFELPDAERQKTIGALPDPQRAQMSGTLRAVAKMTPEERAQYLEAVSRFSKMTDAERRQFMKNAEEWKQLSPVERQAWRSLVKHLAKLPPMPPGLVYPPMPPGFSLQANATNSTNSPP